MGYVINQYNRSTGVDINTFMDYIKTGTIDHRETQFDIELLFFNISGAIRRGYFLSVVMI